MQSDKEYLATLREMSQANTELGRNVIALLSKVFIRFKVTRYQAFGFHSGKFKLFFPSIFQTLTGSTSTDGNASQSLGSSSSTNDAAKNSDSGRYLFEKLNYYFGSVFRSLFKLCQRKFFSNQGSFIFLQF